MTESKKQIRRKCHNCGKEGYWDFQRRMPNPLWEVYACPSCGATVAIQRLLTA